jgi:hemolysin activation/secretion protein
VSGTDIAAVGKGRVAGVRYTRHLEAAAELQHKVSFGLETRRYGNSGNLGDSALSTLPATLGYSGNWRSADRDVSWTVTWLKNIPAGPNGRGVDLNATGGRAGASAGFHAWKLGAQLTERFANQWTLRASASGQYSRDLLIAAEQFGAGGADSVRGFDERAVAGDQGARLGLELGFAPSVWGEWRLIPHVFADAAAVRRNAPLPGEIRSQSVSSAGLGLRLAYGSHATVRFDWGQVLRGMESAGGTSAPTGAVRGNSRLHLSATWDF